MRPFGRKKKVWRSKMNKIRLGIGKVFVRRKS